MSGPKKSDVQAQLNVARNAQHQCESLISKSEHATIDALLQQAQESGRHAARAEQEAQRAVQDLAAEMQTKSTAAVSEGRNLADELARSIAEIEHMIGTVHSTAAEALQSERDAALIFVEANKAYEHAVEALRRSTTIHGLHAENALALAATSRFDQAKAELNRASALRRKAAAAVSRALQLSSETLAAARHAPQRLDAIRAETEARLQAEAEAARIAEENKRLATIAVDHASSALERVRSGPHSKFRPGDVERVELSLQSVRELLRRGRCEEAAERARDTERDAVRLGQEVEAALREFERHRSAAEASVSTLQTTIFGIDVQLLETWSDHQEALGNALAALNSATVSIEAEDFDDAESLALTAIEVLDRALRSAAENKSDDGVRSHIAGDIMDVFAGLGYTPSYKPGTRTTPMVILGQNPSSDENGDFTISIPLNGEVDFLVEHDQGNTSCVDAVKALEGRLAERGIRWRTTNWGPDVPGGPVNLRPLPPQQPEPPEVEKATIGVKVQAKTGLRDRTVS